jgi:hypothetical protein
LLANLVARARKGLSGEKLIQIQRMAVALAAQNDHLTSTSTRSSPSTAPQLWTFPNDLDTLPLPDYCTAMSANDTFILPPKPKDQAAAMTGDSATSSSTSSATQPVSTTQSNLTIWPNSSAQASTPRKRKTPDTTTEPIDDRIGNHGFRIRDLKAGGFNEPTGACTNCRKGKVKCDRSQPCSSCVRRGKELECEYEPNIGIKRSVGTFDNVDPDPNGYGTHTLGRKRVKVGHETRTRSTTIADPKGKGKRKSDDSHDDEEPSIATKKPRLDVAAPTGYGLRSNSRRVAKPAAIPTDITIAGPSNSQSNINAELEAGRQLLQYDSEHEARLNTTTADTQPTRPGVQGGLPNTTTAPLGLVPNYHFVAAPSTPNDVATTTDAHTHDATTATLLASSTEVDAAGVRFFDLLRAQYDTIKRLSTENAALRQGNHLSAPTTSYVPTTNNSSTTNDAMRQRIAKLENDLKTAKRDAARHREELRDRDDTIFQLRSDLNKGAKKMNDMIEAQRAFASRFEFG